MQTAKNPNNSEKLLFDNARQKVLGDEYRDCGIGTYREKSLHKILKFFIEPREEFHEVRFLGSVADIKNDSGIFEIQTRGFSNLKKKLEKFLPKEPVTVVYPLPYEKYIRYIDKSSGEISERRKSPKKSSVFDAFYELYNIREFIGNENLRIKLIFLNVDEFKYIGGRVIGRERRFVRAERIPISIEKIIDINSADDYRIFIPENLPYEFSAAEFGRAISKKFKHGYSGIQILISAGLVTEGEAVGRKKVYKLI